VGSGMKCVAARKKRILLVDDDQELVAELSSALEDAGYGITACFSGEEALHAVLASKPELIILDMKMSGKNGLQVADQLHHSSDLAHVPIVAMTAFFKEADHLPLMQFCGITRRLIKPFAVEALLRVAAELLAAPATSGAQGAGITVHQAEMKF